MMMAGMWGGRSSRVRIRARSSVLLLDAGFVSYAAGRGCMRDRCRMVALLSHAVSWVMLSMARKNTMAVAWLAMAECGCDGGKTIGSMGGNNEW